MPQPHEVAVYGGSFDPPTLAHEAIIRSCLEDYRYDEVWVMPSGARTDKPGMTPDATRLDLLRTVKGASFNDNPRLTVSDFELNLPRPTETAATYRALRRNYPGTSFWFVYGADSLQSMDQWPGGGWLRANLAILAVPRAGFDLPPESARLRHIAPDAVFAADVSSTEVRRRIAEHGRYRELVTYAVAEHIAEAQLYR